LSWYFFIAHVGYDGGGQRRSSSTLPPFRNAYRGPLIVIYKKKRFRRHVTGRIVFKAKTLIADAFLAESGP